MTEDAPVKQWCARHWGIVRDNVYAKKMNGIAAATRLMEEFIKDERVMRRCGWNPDTGAQADSNPAVMNAVIAECSPICCFLEEEALKRVFAYGRRMEPSQHQMEKRDGGMFCVKCECGEGQSCGKAECIHCGS